MATQRIRPPSIKKALIQFQRPYENIFISWQSPVKVRDWRDRIGAGCNCVCVRVWTAVNDNYQLPFYSIYRTNTASSVARCDYFFLKTYNNREPMGYFHPIICAIYIFVRWNTGVGTGACTAPAELYCFRKKFIAKGLIRGSICAVYTLKG